MCGRERINSKDTHILIKPFLEVAQVINDVNINQCHVHSDYITIVSLHPKCKILPIMALRIITLSCLMSPLSDEILGFQLQIRRERSGWYAVRLLAEAPATAVTKHILWKICRTGRITDIRVAPARDCRLLLNLMENVTFMPQITSVQDTSMKLICKNTSELSIRETLFRNRQMNVARQPPLPCLRNKASKFERTQISKCLGQRFVDTFTTHSLGNKEMTLWCMNASITLTTITRALRDNAYLRTVRTDLNEEWLWWDGQKTWTLLSEDQLVEGHLRSKSLEIQAKASNCITDYCVAVGRLIY